MKLNIGDKIKIEASGHSVVAIVEDSSKGDVVQAKVESSSGNDSTYVTGKVYEFKRSDIK